MVKIRTETLIIGAGPAGLAAAMELLRAEKDFTIVEKQSEVGGLARTYVVKEENLEFRTDNGPHRFFSKNEYLYEFISSILSEKWIKVRRQTRQYIDGVFFDYPINARQVVRNLGVLMVARVLFDYMISIIRYRIFKKPIHTFKDFAYASFGKTLAEFNIINYTEKVWGISTDELHKDWAGQRISGLNITSVLLNMLKGVLPSRNSSGPKSLVDAFWYPETGTGLIYETIRGQIEASGRKVMLQTAPRIVHHAGNRVTAVTLQSGQSIEFDNLIESVHIDDFLKLMDPPPPKEVQEAASKLRYRNQVYLFITLDKEKITDDQWIYFPKPEVPFDRVSEMRNFSPLMSPVGKTSLFIEFFCFETDAEWTMSASELLALALPHFEKGGFFKASDVRHAYKFQGGKDYAIYDLAYREHLNVVKGWLDGFENLYFIGRPGRFKYTNQDHSLEMGMLAGWSVIEGKRRDIEAVGSETEYFEKGSLPSSQKSSQEKLVVAN